MPHLPPPDVLSAFDISGRDTIEPLPGGRGLCFRANDIVLRPSDDDAESQWVAEVLLALTQAGPTTTIYRLPAPIAPSHPSIQASSTPSFVYSGWTAWSFLPGRSVRGSPPIIDTTLTLCRAFHADVGNLNLPKPAFLDRQTDRFHLADRITWGELSFDDITNVLDRDVLARIKPHLDVFSSLMRPFQHTLACQLIHGDMVGNILFDSKVDGNNGSHPPAIIDQTPFWRPAAYAEAIIIADGLIWDGHGQDFIGKLGNTNVHLQLLVRALYYRCLTFAIDSDMAFVEPMLPKTKFTSAAKAVSAAIQAVDAGRTG